MPTRYAHQQIESGRGRGTFVKTTSRRAATCKPGGGLRCSLERGHAGAHHVVTPPKKRAPSKSARAMPKRSSSPLVKLVTFAVEPTLAHIQAARRLLDSNNGGLSLDDADQVRALLRRWPVTGWRIRFEALTTSQNVLVRKYGNVHKYKQLIASLAESFWAAMAQGKIPQATARRHLTITRFVRSERFWLDRGNLVGGCKPLLDAAVKAGLIRDDREADLDDHYRQAIDHDERIEITVHDGTAAPA